MKVTEPDPTVDLVLIQLHKQITHKTKTLF